MVVMPTNSSPAYKQDYCIFRQLKRFGYVYAAISHHHFG